MAKRRNGEGFIRQKPGRKGLWEIRISVPQIDGSKKQRTFYAASYALAQQKLNQLRVSNQDGLLRPDSAPPFGVWLESWIANALPSLGLKSSTVNNYKDVYRSRVIADPIMKLKLDKVRATDVEKFLSRLSSAGLGTSMRRIALTLLKKSLDAALRDGHIHTNPCISVVRPKRETDATKQWLSLSETSKILIELSKSVYFPATLMLAVSGMRRGEVLALKWADVDFANERVFIRSTLNRVNGRLEISTPKTSNSRRTLFMTSEMRALLEAVHETRLNSATSSTDAYVFTNNLGNPIEPRNMLKSFKAAAGRAGLPEATLHSLRHAAASQMLNSGVPLFTVSKTLGHSSVAVTGDIYGHLEDGAQKSAISALSESVSKLVMAQNGGTKLIDLANAPVVAGIEARRPLVPQTSALPSCAIARCRFWRP